MIYDCLIVVLILIIYNIIFYRIHKKELKLRGLNVEDVAKDPLF